MNSLLKCIFFCACILLSLAAENKSLSDKVENKDASIKKTDLTAEETRRQSSSYKPPLRNIPNPESEYGLVDDYPPGPVGPAQHSSNYGGLSGPAGGYPSSQISGGYDSSYPSSGYSGTRGGPSSLGGYDSPYTSGGYGPSNSYGGSYSPNDYGPSPHTSSGYGPAPPSSSGYGSPYPPSGYSSPHPSSGYGSAPYSPGSYGAPSPPSSSYTSSHSTSGPSSYSPGSYNSYPSSNYGPSNPPRGYSSSPYSPPVSGYSNPTPHGYGQSYSSNRYNPSAPSHGYRAPPAPAYNPTQTLGGYAEYGPESYRPSMPDYSPSPPRPLSGGGHLKIGSSASSAGSGNYPSNAYSSGGRSKPSPNYGGRDSYSKPGSPSGYDRKYSTGGERYSRPFRSTDTPRANYESGYESKNRKQSARHSGYVKAPLTSGKYSKPAKEYDNQEKYGSYSTAPRGSSYDKPTHYRKLSSLKSEDDSYGSYSKPQSYSKASNSNSKSVESHSYSKSTSDRGYTKPREEYDDYDKAPRDYASDPGYDGQEEYSTNDKPKERYAGYKKHPGKAGASQFDGGYGGYATGPPARGYGDLNKNGVIGSLLGNAGNTGFGPSSSLLPGNSFSQLPQTTFTQGYDGFLGNTGTSGFSGFGLGGDMFSKRGLVGDHGLYGAASYGRNYGANRYDGLGNKAYSEDQSIYGGYAHLY